MLFSLINKIRGYLFDRRMAKLSAARAKEPPPPPTKLEELLAFSERLADDVERFGYRFGDGIDEGLIEQGEPVVSAVNQLKFAANRIKDELLIKVQQQ